MLIFLLILSLSAPAGDCGALRRLYAQVAVSGDDGQARTARAALDACIAPTSSGASHIVSPPPDDGRCAHLRAQVAELDSLGGDTMPFQGLLAGCPTTTAKLPGNWSFLSATVTSPFGWRIHPIKKRRKHHDGVDLDAEPGDIIPALAAGSVVRARRASGYGLLVEIEHEGGTRTRYAHNDRLLVQEGDRVKAGQSLAEAGSTGLSTGVHVHLEVLVAGRAVDPMPYIRNPSMLGG